VTWRALGIFVGVSALALAGLALVYAVLAVRRRARAGRSRVWGGLVFRGALIAGLIAVGVASLRNLPPPQLVNRSAPAPADATIAFVQTPRSGNAQTVVGVSARDGAIRWTRAFNDPIESLYSPSPEIILALPASINKSVYALRLSDGAILWRSRVAEYMVPATMASDGARVYAQVPANPARGTGAMDIIALNLQTGALDWRVPLPASANLTQRLAAGDGQVFVAGAMTGAGASATPNPWMVMALRASDGALQWTKAGVAASQAYDTRIRALFVSQGYAIIVPIIGPVTALRERDGAIAWTATPDTEQPDIPPQNFAATADSETIYLLSQPSRWTPGASGAPTQPPVSLTAMAIGGTIRWRVPSASSAWSSLALSDGVLLSGMSVSAWNAWAGYNPNDNLLTAYDAASGRLLWRENTPPTGISWDLSPEISSWGGSGATYLMGIQTSPYVQDFLQCVVFCHGVSWLYAVNIHTGAPWWRVRMGYVNLSHWVL
jgi:outer membrane protein assembly factor BamB